MPMALLMGAGHDYQTIMLPVKELMAFIENATPNTSIERTDTVKPVSATHVKRWA